MQEQGLTSKLVDREIDRGDLLQAASYGFDVLTKNQRRDFLRSACQIGSASPSELHKALVTLGPTCFVTTNYDLLIEESIQQWRPGEHYDKVDNSSPLEAANILRATATSFIFKPHGDIGKSDSIILTREDYRTFYGKNAFVLASVKTILATRPVVFVGFGLRDPDFLLIKDTLAETFSGSITDHYAIIPDLHEEEVGYWRRNYGIHLVGYESRANQDPIEQHLPLLHLVADLSRERPLTAIDSAGQHKREEEATRVLCLLRHLARMQLLVPEPAEEELPILVTVSQAASSRYPVRYARIHGSAAPSALIANDSHILLTGSAGAGKTHVVRSAVVSLAQKARDQLLINGSTWTDVRIPIYVHLRSYGGDLWALVQGVIPAGLELSELAQKGRLAFFLDGANEIDNMYHESNRFAEDLQRFAVQIGRSSLVLISRSNVSAGQNDLDELQLDEIDRKYVVERFKIFDNEAVIQLLQKPLFLRMVVNQGVDIKGVALPHDLYRLYLRHLEDRFREHFRENADLSLILGQIAFDLIDSGGQEFSAIVLASEIESMFDSRVHYIQFLNWLINQNVLIPLPGNKVSFSHHLLSEYLAAFQLSKIYDATARILNRCMRHRSWDASLLLALGFMDPRSADRFFGEVLRVDPCVALRSLDYIDSEREKWTYRALEYVRHLEMSFSDEMRISFEMKKISPPSGSVELLWELCRRGNVMGAAAAHLLKNLLGHDSVIPLLDLVLLHFDDYNFCSSAGESLGAVVSVDDIKYFFERAVQLNIDRNDPNALAAGEEVPGLVSLINAGGGLLQRLTVGQILDAFGPLRNWPLIVRRMILEHLRDLSNIEALRLTTDILLLGDPHAVWTIYSQCNLQKPTEEDLAAIYSQQLLDIVVGHISGRQNSSRWAADLLRGLAERSSQWRTAISSEVGRHELIIDAILCYACDDFEGYFHGLRQCMDAPVELIASAQILSHCRVDWRGHEDLLVTALRIRDPELTLSLLESLDVFGEPPDLSVDFGNVEWWIDCLADFAQRSEFFPCDRLGRFIAGCAGEEFRDVITKKFNEGSEIERRVLEQHVLARMNGFGLERITPDALSWLLSELSIRLYRDYALPLLAVVSTERFVEERLLPLYITSSSEIERANLVLILQECGRRHGRRYLRTGGAVLG